MLYPPVQAPGLLILFWRSLESSDLVEKLQETVHPLIFLIMTVSMTLSLSLNSINSKETQELKKFPLALFPKETLKVVFTEGLHFPMPLPKL